jgi:hypothetical protein
MLKAECPECGYTIRLSKRWPDVGLPSCPTDGAALALDGAGEVLKLRAFMCSSRPRCG